METEPQVSLTINDIEAAATLIDLVMARGAIKATEARAVGQLYDKLSAFVASVKQATEAKTDNVAEQAANDSDAKQEAMAE